MYAESVYITKIVSFWQNTKLSLMDVPPLGAQKILLRWCGVRIAKSTIKKATIAKLWDLLARHTISALLAKGEKKMRLIDADALCDECIDKLYMLSCECCVIRDFKLHKAIELNPCGTGSGRFSMPHLMMIFTPVVSVGVLLLRGLLNRTTVRTVGRRWMGRSDPNAAQKIPKDQCRGL